MGIIPISPPPPARPGTTAPTVGPITPGDDAARPGTGTAAGDSAEPASSLHESRLLADPRLSVAIICCNNESSIERTLESIRPLNAEIVALDSGSTDGTLEILKRHGARVIHQPWLGHVSQKQVAMERARGAWILSLDSDESLEPDLLASVRVAIARDDPAIAGYEVNRKVWWAGGFLNYAWQPEWRLRLVRRGMARWGGYDPHDKLEVKPSSHQVIEPSSAGTRSEPANGAPSVRATDHVGRVERLSGTLRHDTIPSLDEFLRRQVSHAEIASRSYAKLGRRGRVSGMITSPVGAFLKQIVLRSAWRDGWRGWVAAAATANAALLKHMMLVESDRRFTTENTEHTEKNVE